MHTEIFKLSFVGERSQVLNHFHGITVAVYRSSKVSLGLKDANIERLNEMDRTDWGTCDGSDLLHSHRQVLTERSTIRRGSLS